MPKVVISDTSCFIVLINIHEMDLMNKLYGMVTTTPEIINELGHSLPEWVKVQAPSNTIKQRELESIVDKGEASAIALALEIANSLIVLDDLRARVIAEDLGLEVTGTLGVIVKCKREGIITSIKPIIDKLRATDFRLTDELEHFALMEAGETT